MKARTLGLLAVAGAAAVAIVVRRRAAAVSGAPVQLGLADGSSLTLEAGEPGVAEIQQLAADLRGSLEAG